MEEVWKDVTGYAEPIQISNYGRLRKLRSGKIYDAATSTGRKTYYYSVSVKGKDGYATVYIHKLVALYFVDNPLNKPVVNHIDGNKYNNKADNLEWVTYAENTQHAVRTGLLNYRKPVAQYDLDGNKIAEFDSIVSAAKHLGRNSTNISVACRYRNSTAYGYVWKFINDSD